MESSDLAKIKGIRKLNDACIDLQEIKNQINFFQPNLEKHQIFGFENKLWIPGHGALNIEQLITLYIKNPNLLPKEVKTRCYDFYILLDIQFQKHL